MVRDTDLVSVQEVRTKVEAAWTAFQAYSRFNQQQVDRVVEAMAAAGRAQAKVLAEMAVEETKYGNVQDKIAKNLLNSDLLARAIRGMKTVGVLRELPEQKLVEIGVPVGVVAAVLPTTNPTSTAIFKSLISLKAGNAVVISPHPRAAKCTAYTAELLHRAAVEAGAPEGVVQCIANPTMESTHALMKHERVALILATGGQAMVRAAYSSGKPAFGVGPGNVPVYIDRTADVADAVEKVVAGKKFDYGTVCSSEQTLVAEEPLREAVLAELKRAKACLLSAAQQQALIQVLLKDNYRINPECVGQSPLRIAEMAGFEVPADTSILVVEIQGVGKAHPLSVEKLSPVLALYFVRDPAAAMEACEGLLRFGGLGHTCVIYSKDEARIREFALRMPAMRVLVNTSAPQGSTGVTTNLLPSMTLGCGAMGGNITGDNVGPLHLINIKRLAYGVRTAEEALPIPAEFRDEPARPRAAMPVAAQPALLDRRMIAEAVEQYLAERGGSRLAGGAAAAAGRPAAVSSAALGNVAAQVVDRFIACRRTRASSQPPACLAQCPCLAPTEAAAAPDVPAPQAPVPEAPAPRAPEVIIADFVCESDVRAAIDQHRKIYTGPRTIVTPAARELAQQYDVLVVARR